jgi:D-alanyl-D-alanine carboxypeptidase/D-alanyl-D-alanine carboxypeptidase (penicillin-binding protein 5/6)
MVFNSIPVFAWTPSEKLSAKSAILIETGRGQVLYEKEADNHISPSIMCKLMMALVVIEKTDLNSKVTISKNSANINGASLNLVVGNLYSVEDLLYAVMLSQGNDAAIALAEYVGDGDVNKFVGLMNDKAKELVLSDTHFVNPTGLYDEKQYTSVKDIAKLIKTAVSNPVFNNIFASRGIAWLNGKASSILTNQNKLFWSYTGVDGGKIGTTPQQGTTSVTTATRNGRRLVAVILDKDEKTALNETTQLLDYGFSHFYSGTLVSKDTILRSITIQDVNINLISKMDIFYTYPIGESYIKSIKFTQNEKLKLPINTDTIAGVLSYTLTDGTIIDINLYSDKNVVAPEDYKSKIQTILKENHDLMVIVFVLAVIEVILIIHNLLKLIYRLSKKKNKD